jgi:hypothetical protein
MTTTTDKNTLIERPDGSTIAYGKLETVKQLEHDLVLQLCEMAQAESADLLSLKRHALSQMVATRTMMLDDHGVKKGGKDGNMTLRSVCGRFMVKMTVSKHISFGPELEAAKALIFEVIEDELNEGGSSLIRSIVEDVFSLNGKGRIDTQGIMNLRTDKYAKEVDDARWDSAMNAIETAILRDSATTYINFYRVDPNAKDNKEQRIKLDLASV